MDGMILDLIINPPPLLQNYNSRSIFFANNIRIEGLKIDSIISVYV
jgi:hypothetical protein